MHQPTTITLADRRNLPEASTPRSGRLAFKNADGQDESPAGQMLAVDETEGIVTAIVSVTGTEDEVADIIEPGAYRTTLTKRRPKVCWAHAWDLPIGRVLHIEELMPGDERLPVKTRDGKGWPREAGALVATMQFNMKSDVGRNAFEAVRFYSESGECEYSIGYQVPPGKATKNPKTGVRHIKALELYELSVVLFGAHTQTGTLSIKDAIASVLERKSTDSTGTTVKPLTEQQRIMRPAPKPAPRRVAPLTGKAALAAVREDKDFPPKKKPAADEAEPDADAEAEPDKAEKPDKPDEPKAKPDFTNGVMVALYPDGGAADAVAGYISGPDDTTERADLHVTLAYLGDVHEVAMSQDDIANAVTGAVEGIPVLEGTLGGIGQFPDSGDGAPTWLPVDVDGLSLLREQIVAALGQDVETDHGFTPHMTLGFDIGLIEPVPEIPVTFSSVRVVYGTSQTDIALGAAGLPIEDPTPGKSIAEVVRLTALSEIATKAGGTDRDRGGADKLRDYWVHGEGAAKIAWNTPGDFTRCVALLEEHMPGRAEGYCANRHREATGMWPGDKDNKSFPVDTYDPTRDQRTVGKSYPSVAGAFPYLPGTFEDRMNTVREAVNAALRGEPVNEDGDKYEWDHVTVDATWDDRVIATRCNYTTDDRETFEMPYRITDEGVTLGEPEPVELQVVAVTPDGQAADELPIADALPLAEDVGRIIYALKATRPAMIEGKAGRVLSGRNERRLRDAVQGLLDVLAAAGVVIGADDPHDPVPPRTTAAADDSDTRREIDPNVDLESTAPSAAVGRTRKVLTLDAVNADLTELGLENI